MNGDETGTKIEITENTKVFLLLCDLLLYEMVSNIIYENHIEM